MSAEKIKLPPLREADFDRDPDARQNLLEIIYSRARNIYPREAAWFLGASESEVYSTVPRVKGLGKAVRFDGGVLVQLKDGHTNQSSLKIEKNADPKRTPRKTAKNREKLWD